MGPEELHHKEMSLELLFVTEILKLNSLHYGYWKEHESLNLDNFKKAQKRYTVTLMHLIPKNVKTILDVGCGIGDNALALAEKNYSVTAISPDKNHIKYLSKHNHINFYTTTIEEFQPKKKYDLMLFSESQTYFSPLITFKKAQDILNKKGYILVSDFFNIRRGKELSKVNSTEEEYIQKAKEYNLKLIKSIDITKDVLPTIELAHKIHIENIQPALRILDSYVKTAAPLKYQLLKLLFYKQWKQFSKTYEYYKKRLDPSFFKKELSYKRLLLQIK